MLGKILKYGAKALVNIIKGEDTNSSQETELSQINETETDSWDYKKSNYPKLVALIRKYEHEQAAVEVRWEAGGDECPIYCTVNGRSDFSEAEQPLFNQIGSLIIDRLDLPGAGEIFNDGSARLFTKGDKLYLNTSYTYYEYYYTDDEEGPASESLRLHVQLPDPYGWEALLKRADLQVNVSLNSKGDFNFSMWVNVRNGDSYEISEEQHTFYEDVFKKEIQKLSPEFKKSKDGHPLYKLNIWHSLRNSLALDAEVECSYIEIHEEATNKEVELVP